jgi:hypothetical protein
MVPMVPESVSAICLVEILGQPAAAECPGLAFQGRQAAGTGVGEIRRRAGLGN